MGAVDAEARVELQMPAGREDVGPVPELVESLLHDARNPLNAISIHLEVLGTKLQDDEGVVPAPLQKNLRAIREQVARLDGMLRQFGSFLSSRPEPVGPVELRGLVRSATEVLAHLARRRRLGLELAEGPEVLLSAREPSALRQLILATLNGGIQTAPEGLTLRLQVRREEGSACVVLEAEGGIWAQDTQPWHPAESLAGRLEATLTRQGAWVRLRVPTG